MSPEPYCAIGDIVLHRGDCLERMAAMEANSIDAICTDPPYGLEFMGKEWDKLDGGLPQENVWKGRHGKGGSNIGNDHTKPGSRHRVALGGGKRHRFRRCSVCGRREFSGNPCACDLPKWVNEWPAGPPSGAIRMQRWHTEWAKAALRVAKPGAFLLAFGGTRTWHRLACAIEDAGWELRDTLMWLYGSGFPKSLDISKAIDKAAGAEREVVGSKVGQPGYSLSPERGQGIAMEGNVDGSLRNPEAECAITAPATDAAREWSGWGTALKPAWEPILVAMKPTDGTFAENAQRHGIAGLHVDGGRIEGRDRTEYGLATAKRSHGSTYGSPSEDAEFDASKGRWPPNLALDTEAAAMLDAQTGDLRTNPGTMRKDSAADGVVNYGPQRKAGTTLSAGDTGGASRFFYVAKASSADRGNYENAALPLFSEPASEFRNTHPTVKPLALMEWLLRLVGTPTGGVVLDPFAGSGTTLVAAQRLGRACVGIELDERYCEIARHRLEDQG